MWHGSVSDSSAMSVARRVLAGAALVAAGYLAALFTPISGALVGAPAIGNVSDAGTAASSVVAPGGSTDGPDRSSQRDFDYFPDHYVNQAREVADQPPPF